jgi:hypothetical protein
MPALISEIIDLISQLQPFTELTENMERALDIWHRNRW